MFIYKNKICGIKKYRTTNNPQLEAFPEEDWLHERGASLADSDWPPSGGGYSDQWEHDTSFLAAPTFRGNVNSQRTMVLFPYKVFRLLRKYKR